MRKGYTSGFLRYQVPHHQDSTVLLAALGKQGYDATPLYEHAVTTLTIPYTGRPDEERERVRRILAEVHESTLGGPELIFGPVRFQDEPGEGPRALPPAELASLQAPTVLRTVHEAQPTVANGLTPLARAAWGFALLAGTDPVCRTLAVPPTSKNRLVVRALGARHLVWTGVTAAVPTRRTLLIGAALDSAYAVTALGYAVPEARRRRGALASAGVATVFALDAVRRARGVPSGARRAGG